MNYFYIPVLFAILFIFSLILFIIKRGRCIGYSPGTLQERLDIKSKMVEK